MKKRMASLLCVLALVVSMAPAAVAGDSPAGTAKGWFEALSVQIPGVSDADVTAVTYSGAMSGALEGEDFTYLVRDIPGGVRVDLPGLKAGSYDVTVTAAGKDYTFTDIAVSPFDRSGFAHKVHTRDEAGEITGITDYTEGVGAYNDDGTLKENALVLYVTDENKETVSLTAGGITVTGIGNILNASGKEYEAGTGQTKKGGKANTNQDILKKLGEEGRPLVVRFIGDVTQPYGVSAKASLDFGGSLLDNGGVAGIREINNMTLEGIGDDAFIDGWGFSYVRLSGGVETGLGKNFEVRNLTFINVPEDCIGINGTAGSDGFGDPVEHCWVHNCEFYRPDIKDPAEDDKAQGDGAVDFKVGQYMTMSYNYFDSYHKTSLLGGGDSHKQYHVTWHHNWWKNVESRSPLCRQADIHIYNNLYDGQSFYCMSLRANCFVYSEYNAFLNCKNPFIDEGTGGVCKSWNDFFEGCYGKDEAVKAADRAQTVENENRYANFDTDPVLSYIPAGDYLLDEDVAVAREKITAFAGTMGGRNGNAAAPVAASYEDVSENDWFYDSVMAGLIPGVDDTHFAPHETASVADAAAWVGVESSTAPEGEVTREQLAALLFQKSGAAAHDGDLSAFADGEDVSADAVPAVLWAVEKGIIKGRTGGVLAPKAPATRAEIAAMLVRAAK